LASQFAGKAKTSALGLGQLTRYLDQADIVIGAASSSIPLLSQSLVEKALKLRKRKPMLILDLAVPRNIEAGVGGLEDVYLYCLDDLQRVLQKHQSLKQVAAFKAERFIREATTHFMSWLQAQDSFKTVAIFRGQFDRIRDDCLAQSLKRLQLGDDPEKILKRLAHDLTNQFLHKPTHCLRVASLKGEHSLCNTIRDLFELNHESFSTE
jgi:glutamyl-tRNA reductase